MNGRRPETLTAGALRRLPELLLDRAEQRRDPGFDHRPKPSTAERNASAKASPQTRPLSKRPHEERFRSDFVLW
ncbi:hypothetical protein SAMN05444336_10897 [Albimonas donghaensis]|uniref:Uncharacterized protein n=2 Tax=Albimonas donghaensis TaxID=356660 RepID=A0A1H3DPW4_9RHOB|nr:hypothetical protein SAMN05444336_10897 [Albimonas donghaensis]